jgi:uncharacterized protein (TIGR04551 family)
MRFSATARRGRFPAVLLVSLLVAPAAGAQQQPGPAAPPSATPPPAPPPAAPGAAQPPSKPAPAAAPADPQAEALRREVERVKQELRDEIRAEMQAQQSAREFLQGAADETRKLQFLELDGYLRVRSDLFNGMDLGRAPDPLGFFVYPRPLINPDESSTLTNVNMRLRMSPILNVSEEIRVLGQVDVLDNLVLGSTPGSLFQRSDATDFLSSRTQLPLSDGFNADRDSIRVKRAWAEVRTPVGLLAFGRQPASWGLGMLQNPGEELDDDFGDTVDRIQFAIPLRSTPIGPITVVPLYDLVATGLTSADLQSGRGIGQPFDREQGDDATALGFKIVRAETEEERRLKIEQGLSSWNYGLFYRFLQQGFAFPQFESGQLGTPPSGGNQPEPTDPQTAAGRAVRRDASAHVLDLWGRWQTRRWRFEWELAGVLGEIGNASDDADSPLDRPVLLRQFGLVLQGEHRIRNRMTLGTEVGLASGDRNPGFGNQPGRGAGPPGTIDGRQFTPDDGVMDVRNFRFSQAYRVDLVLFRELLGNVTDAWYAKPTFRYELIDGLELRTAIIYSQAMRRESTPSGRHKPLGIEADLGVHYRSDDGFHAWLDWGVLQPLDGFLGAGDTSRAHAIRTGLAVKF